MKKITLDSFFNSKRVLVTGHAGFKGSWLSFILSEMGAEVFGYSYSPIGQNALFDIIRCGDFIHNEIGDVRDFKHLKEYFEEVKPEIVFHLAAQPIVRESYKDPRYTFETNVMGSVNVCECIRECDTVKSFLNVTTDKVYYNNEWEWGYRETDPLDGYDPYSNSKSCSELVTHSYNSSFLKERGVAVSTARAGNVVGGGDFSIDRIIPDCVRAVSRGEKIILRNPYSTRPFQHVLEPLFAYMMIAAKQFENRDYADSYNVGPDDMDCVSVENLVSLFCKEWGQGAKWSVLGDGGPHEANFLKLDCSRLKSRFGWNPRWGISEAVKKTIEWYKLFDELQKRNAPKNEISESMREVMRRQIKEYLGE